MENEGINGCTITSIRMNSSQIHSPEPNQKFLEGSLFIQISLILLPEKPCKKHGQAEASFQKTLLSNEQTNREVSRQLQTRLPGELSSGPSSLAELVT